MGRARPASGAGRAAGARRRGPRGCAGRSARGGLAPLCRRGTSAQPVIRHRPARSADPRLRQDHLSRRPPFEFAARELVFIKLDYEFYTQDFVQNDPFLRGPVIFLLSRRRANDEILLRKYFPAARHVRDAPYGHVWRLD
jgi:hypothetical protein